MTQWFSLKRLFGFREPPPLWAPPAMAEPVEPEEEHHVSALAAPLHVHAGSALVRVDNGVVVVEREGEERFERPIELVSAVHIHGWATITSPAVAQLIAQGAPVIWRGATGYPIGSSAPLAMREE
jgi:hypothetical protein